MSLRVVVLTTEFDTGPTGPDSRAPVAPVPATLDGVIGPLAPVALGADATVVGAPEGAVVGVGVGEPVSRA